MYYIILYIPIDYTRALWKKILGINFMNTFCRKPFNVWVNALRLMGLILSTLNRGWFVPPVPPPSSFRPECVPAEI